MERRNIALRFEYAREADRDAAPRPSVPEAVSEGAQVQRAKAGDDAVWEAWFDAFYPKLYRYAFTRLGRKADAEDVAGLVFLEAVRQIDRFQYTGRPVLAWLYRIAHNLVYDRLKRTKRPVEREDAAITELVPGPDVLVTKMDLLTAINELTDEQREVIILRFYLSMSAQEVGNLLGRPAGAVFSLQARAIVNLRERLR